MADNFDPLKNKYSEPQHQASSNRASNKNSSQLPRQQSDPNGSNTHQPLAAGLPYQSQNVKVIEQQTQPYWESHEDSFENCGRDGAEGYPSEDYASKQACSYYQEDCYNYDYSYKRNRLAAKIDKFVQRFPVLGKFYKQPPSSPTDPGPGFQYDRMFGSISSTVSKHEVNADDLALERRYSDTTRTKSIGLQAIEQTQPVDVSVLNSTKRLYLCDVGRSLVEIFDMNGTLEHAINDSIMTKFQPTAIAVGCDGTIITASHFNHRLHMHYPEATKPYTYKQFKLGVEGNQIHQFYHPSGIVIDNDDGSLYACDRGNNRIQVITPEGLCVRVISLYLYGSKKYPMEPIRIALQRSSGHLVCITGVGEVMCFIPKDSNGPTYISPIAITDANGLGLENASGLAVDSKDRIFISDTGHNRIIVCTPDGSYLTSFGTEGNGPGQLKRPCGLDVTDDGTVVVTDPGNKRIQLFGLVQEGSEQENNTSEQK